MTINQDLVHSCPTASLFLYTNAAEPDSSLSTWTILSHRQDGSSTSHHGKSQTCNGRHTPPRPSGSSPHPTKKPWYGTSHETAKRHFSSFSMATIELSPTSISTRSSQSRSPHVQSTPLCTRGTCGRPRNPQARLLTGLPAPVR